MCKLACSVRTPLPSTAATLGRELANDRRASGGSQSDESLGPSAATVTEVPSAKPTSTSAASVQPWGPKSVAWTPIESRIETDAMAMASPETVTGSDAVTPAKSPVIVSLPWAAATRPRQLPP